MLKKTFSLAISACIAVAALAAPITSKSSLDKRVIGYMHYEITHDPRFHMKLDSISIKSAKSIHDGWKAYVLNLRITTPKGRTFVSPYVLFTNGYYATAALADMKTHQALQNRIFRQIELAKQKKRDKWAKSFVLPSKYYNKEHLLIGKLAYKNKIVLLSDPLCIACIGTLPSLFHAIKASGKKVAVFYYDFPITQLHPTSKVMAELMLYAQAHGIKNVIKRVYAANFDNVYKKYFHTSVYTERNPQIAVKAFNKVFHTNYNLQDIKPVKYAKRVDEDMKLGQVVRLIGTPTILFNGTTYHSRQRLQQFLIQR